MLFSLTVLTLIFGAASTRTLTHIERVRVDAALAQKQHDTGQIGELLIRIGPASLDSDRSLAVLADMTLQPATGLVDLNTASPTLLAALLQGYGLPDNTINDALTRYRTWRREGRKLLRVSDFRRVTGLSAEQLPDLKAFTTVYSGRTGIAVEQAPLALLRHLTQVDGPRELVTEQLDPSFVTPGSMVNLHAQVGETQQMVVSLGGGANASRVLGVR